MAKIKSYKLNAKHRHAPTIHAEAGIQNICFTPVDGILQFHIEDEVKGRSFRVHLDENDLVKLVETETFKKAVTICKERVKRMAGF